MEVETIDLETFHARLKAQQVPQLHLAFKCPMCATVQSPATLIIAGAGADFEEVEKFIGFSCVGRWTAAGPPPRTPEQHGGKGCNWTLGGLFNLHRLVVLLADGKQQPSFEPASPEEATTLFARTGRLECMAGGDC